MTSDIHIHPSADVQTDLIGAGTRIWQSVVILPQAVIGKNANICAHCFIENDVVLGDDVTVKSGVYLWDGIQLGDGVFIGPNVTFTNDKYPKSKRYPKEMARTVIETGTSIGGGAVILPGIRIGSSAMVGAGAVVTKSVPPNAIVVGSPARIIGYTPHEGDPRPRQVLSLVDLDLESTSEGEIGVSGVRVVKLKHVQDLRGNLVVGEFEREIPFFPKRYFIIHNVPSKETRGEHAHYQCHQFLVCVRGSCVLMVDDGVQRKELRLDSPEMGVYLPPRIWGVQYKYSRDAMLMVFASDYYDPEDYIRDYASFLEVVQASAPDETDR